MAEPLPRATACAREFSIAAYLHAVAQHLPAALLAPEAIQTIVALAEQLPGGTTSFFGFECPLSAQAASADFLLCSTRDEGHARILAGSHDTIDLPLALLEYPAWQRVRAFCRAWESEAPALLGQIMNIWLEFDVGNHPQAVTCPSVFFGAHPPLGTNPDNDRSAMLRDALALLEPAAIAGARGATLQRICAGLPDGAYAFQIGVMFARQVAAIRVCLRGVEPSSIGALLTKLGWAGARGELETLVSALAPLVERLDIDLDVGDAIGPKIGIECYFGTDAQTALRVRQLGEYLVAQGSCAPSKVEALVQYNGLTHQDSGPAAWPVHLSALAAAQGPSMASCLIRWVHHVKVVYEPAKPLLAKAYLAVEHHVFERRRLAAAIDAARKSAH